MTHCENPEIGALLHGYELDMLSPEDKETVEIHLIECDYCREELSRFSSVTDMIRFDQQLKRAMMDTTDEVVTVPSRWENIKSLIWPETSLLLRPAVSYVLLLLMAIPAVYGLLKFRSNEFSRTSSGINQPHMSSALEATEPGDSNFLRALSEDGQNPSTAEPDSVKREIAPIMAASLTNFRTLYLKLATRGSAEEPVRSSAEPTVIVFYGERMQPGQEYSVIITPEDKKEPQLKGSVSLSGSSKFISLGVDLSVLPNGTYLIRVVNRATTEVVFESGFDILN